MPAYILCDVATSSGSRPEIGAGTDAALAHLDHDGHLCPICPGRPKESRCEADGVRCRTGGKGWSNCWSITGPIKSLDCEKDFQERRASDWKDGGADRDRTGGLLVANEEISHFKHCLFNHFETRLFRSCSNKPPQLAPVFAPSAPHFFFPPCVGITRTPATQPRASKWPKQGTLKMFETISKPNVSEP
jgi:hypothetical protein